MFAQPVVPRERFIESAITNDDVAASLDQETKRVRSPGP
jgi:hypothetical protein